MMKLHTWYVREVGMSDGIYIPTLLNLEMLLELIMVIANTGAWSVGFIEGSDNTLVPTAASSLSSSRLGNPKVLTAYLTQARPV